MTESGTVQDQGGEPTDRPAGYRDLLTLASWQRWNVATTGARIPVAMAPLAFVYVGHAATGSFAVGSVMAGTFSVAEAVCSPFGGRLLDRSRDTRRGVALALLAGAVAMVGLAAAGWLEAPAVLLVALAAACGGVPAAAQGGLRAMLQRILPGRLREVGFAFDATFLEVQWAIAPAIVSLCVAFDVPVLTAVAMAVAAALAAAVALTLPEDRSTEERSPVQFGAPAWRAPAVLGTYLASLMLGYAEGTVTVALPPLLNVLAAPAAYSGLFLLALSVTSALGGWVYGLLTSRLGAPSPTRASLLLVAVGLFVVPIGLSPVVWGVGLGVAALGLFVAPTNAVRSLLLGRLLPAHQHAEGFAMLYGINVLGFGVSGFASAALTSLVGPGSLLVLAGSVTAVVGLSAVALNAASSRSA